MKIKHVKYFMYSISPLIWYYIGTHDKKYTRITMYNKGKILSHKFKKYPIWDAYVEPFAIRQFAILFTGGNAFIKGMISDNENTTEINLAMEQFKNDINEELKDNINKE